MSGRAGRTASQTRGGAVSGGLLGLLTVPLHFVLPHQVSEPLAALVLASILAVYISFAIAEGGTRAVVPQSVNCLAFIGAARAAYLLASKRQKSYFK
ncbi:MAG: hypothetical protein CL814_01795 [Confluentimicrobium sp.]|uniref:hypothetical protein n=1 Tax=Actibacterium sp. TaxID=1872125 RepID=UPI000C4BD704|nr:hypothetical protein [Actibacterium sp.]MBC55649.1 hypothetical protein [Actibacterium sp.]